MALYGRAFQLVDADSFTRAWLAARGTPAGDALPYPEGAIEARARRRREAAAGAGSPAATRGPSRVAAPSGVLRQRCSPPGVV